MNGLERKMVELLVDLKTNYHVTSVKAEFEAEGTRMEEAMRLKEVSMKAGLDMTIKVGGCEALKDMFEAASLGTKSLVAPMVESAFALRKYLGAVRVAFPEDLRREMDFYVNIETITACQNFDAMLALPEIGELSGVVIGRHDLTASLDLPVDAVNSVRVQQLALDVAAKAHACGLKVVVGGAVSAASMPFFRGFPAGHLSKFETRKIVFSCPGALDNPDLAFLKAVEFEIDWLKNKRLYYSAIDSESDARLRVMEARYQKSIDLMHAKKA
jgi:hypothetical protein